jgi:hypothetical protein
LTKCQRGLKPPRRRKALAEYAEMVNPNPAMGTQNAEMVTVYPEMGTTDAEKVTTHPAMGTLNAAMVM